MTIPNTWEFYRHYKSTWWSDYTYECVAIGTHTETEEKMVVYRSLYEDTSQIWIRPLDMRNETVTWEGKKMQRFTKMEK